MYSIPQHFKSLYLLLPFLLPESFDILSWALTRQSRIIKCHSVSLQMTSILTPQEICELDTFTLQEKIQELESLPNAGYYTDLLKIAKLQLIDRLETEQFGRKLANDQYKLVEELVFPQAREKEQMTRQVQTGKLPALSNHRKQGNAKVSSNLTNAGSFVTIGKPAVQHHYKPKAKKVQTVDATKNFLRAKKTNFSRGKLQKVAVKDTLIKKPQLFSKKEENAVVFAVQTASKEIVEVKEVVEEFSLKQKLKREVQQMQVIFRENDAYDDMRQIKLTPQNLLEEEIKMNQTEPISTEIDASEEEKESKEIKEAMEEAMNSTIKNEEEAQQTPVVAFQEEKNHEFIPLRIDFAEQKKEKRRIFRQATTQILAQDKPQPQFFDYQQTHNQAPPLVTPLINLDKLDPPTIKQNKEVKSNSVRSLAKPAYHNMISDNLRPSKGEDYFKQTHIKASSIKLTKQEIKTKPQHRMSKSNYGSFKPISTKPEVYPYHQAIHSFHKLFPHSKNLLITLRNVQENLKLHVSKQVDEKSKSNDYLRLNVNDITFKVISQSQKARKYADCFGIELDSFHQRGERMLHRIRGDHQVPNSDIMLYRVVRTKQQVYDIINSSFHRTQIWHQLPHGMQLRVSWNLLWTWSKPQIDFSDLFFFQKVNHFIGNKQIARKDLLKKNIENVQKLGGKIKQFFDIIPETFLLPGENIAFIKKFREYGLKDPLNYWILKPVGLSRGRGIELVNRLEDVVFSEPVVLQRYVSNPFLVDGFKFDMRIYVLVTSINPLQAFIYKQGFARLSTQRYSLDQQKMDNKYIHLTNFSINRENIAEKKLSLQQQLGGCKISLKMLRRRIEENGIAWEKIEKQIEEIVLKSLIACMNTIPQNPNCFQLFGYDIFLDSNLKCWLLEVNSSPSLEKEFMLDEIIKQQLVDDIMEIVSPVSYNRQRLLEIVQRRRKEAEGLKSSINVSTNSHWQLDEDLHYILNGQKLRKYGETSHRNFKTVAPSDRYYSIVKVLQQYKIDPIIKEEH